MKTPQSMREGEEVKQMVWGVLRRNCRTALIRFAMILPLILFYFLCFNHTEPNEVGIARNWITGKMWLQDKPGWHISSPFTRVAQVDIRPIRVVVTTSGHGFSAKLVKFNPQGWEEFVNTEGFHYYWWYNRLSFNWGYRDEYRGIKDILRGYAYGAKKYSFFTVLEEYH